MEPGETVKVTVTRGGAWVYAKQTGFTITLDRPYLGRIEMRADLPDGQKRNVNWDIKQDISPWRTAISRTIEVTNQWQTFTMAFQPAFAMSGRPLRGGRGGAGRHLLPAQLEPAADFAPRPAAGETLEARTWRWSAPTRPPPKRAPTIFCCSWPSATGITWSASWPPCARTPEPSCPWPAPRWASAAC